ncbi:MAG: hypothetical protein ACFFB8_18130 [Promethearchaeota archaeon]
MEPNRAIARRVKKSGISLVIIGIILIVTGFLPIGLIFLLLGCGISFLIIGVGLLGWSIKELRIEKGKEKMGRRNQSIGLNLIGGSVGVILGFVSQPMFYSWGGHSLWGFYIAGISFLAIIGTLLEFKRLFTGSLICLISGIINLIIVLAIAITLFVITIPYFLIIAGAALGILEARKEKES